MSRLDDLKAELDAGHPDTGAYNANDKLAADELNALNRTKPDVVSETEFQEWSSANQRARNIRAGITNTGLGDQLRNVCLVIDRMLVSGAPFDQNDTGLMALIDDLVTGSVLTSGDKTALVASGTRVISRATEIDLGHVREGHVIQARAL